MKPLVEILQERQRLSLAAFCDRFPWPVLIHRIKAPGDIDASAETQFARPTAIGGSSVGSALLALGLANAKAHAHITRAVSALGGSSPHSIMDGSIVLFLPSQPPGDSGLSIGRASDAAYSLPYAKISKVHAYLRQSSGRWVLIDAGSRNGSQVDGALVSKERPMELKEGALLQFSQFQFLFYSSPGFYRILGDT